MRIYQYQCQRARLSVLYRKHMTRTYKDGMYKIQTEKKGSQNPSYSYRGLKGYRTQNDIKNSITRIHSC